MCSEKHDDPFALCAPAHLRDHGRVGRTAEQEVHAPLHDRQFLGLRRALVLDVDGDDASVGIDVLEEHRPEGGAAALVGAGLDEQVRLHLEEDLLHNPGVEGVLHRGYAEEAVLEDGLPLVPDLPHRLDCLDLLLRARLALLAREGLEHLAIVEHRHLLRGFARRLATTDRNELQNGRSEASPGVPPASIRRVAPAVPGRCDALLRRSRGLLVVRHPCSGRLSVALCFRVASM